VTDETVDDIMERCPLKQEVRNSLWAHFSGLVSSGKPLKSYLTLYSPPMMDIKHFHRRGLIAYDGEQYQGVVAVTYVRQHYAEAMRLSAGRPQLMLYGDINDLLIRQHGADVKKLRQQFPLQVMNLDYTNALFSEQSPKVVSRHFAAIESICRLQQRHGAKQFALFLTTRAERHPNDRQNEFSREFLDELVNRVDSNLDGNRAFASEFEKGFGELRGRALLQAKYEAFVPIGLAKLIAQMLALYGFEIVQSSGCLLERDDRLPARWLLHLAFHVKAGTPAKAKSLTGLGRAKQFHLERKIADFVGIVASGRLRWLKESVDRKPLQARYGTYVEELASETLDLHIPEPTRREAR
jgi:hypothetical protein